MSEKKIVIRFNYSSEPTAASGSKKAKPRLITEWNIKRILIALIVLVLLSLALVYLIFPENGTDDLTTTESDETVVELALPSPPNMAKRPSNNELVDVKRKNKKEAVLSQPTIQKKPSKPDSTAIKQTDQPVQKAKGQQKTASVVVRATLSRKISNREPVGEIISSIHARADRAIGAFYFTELTGMKGQQVSHQWWFKDRLIFEKTVSIRKQLSNFYTSKLLTASMLGPWQVYLKDSNNQILHSDSFELLAPMDEP